jgi:hypothetical protein
VSHGGLSKHVREGVSKRKEGGLLIRAVTKISTSKRGVSDTCWLAMHPKASSDYAWANRLSLNFIGSTIFSPC